MEKPIASFDFDGTLDRADVEDYAAELIALGIPIQVLTAREPENGVDFIDNSDLWDIVDQLAIPKDRVIFTSYSDKADYLVNTTVLFHLDDSPAELNNINRLTSVQGISVNSSNWRDKCEKIIKSSLIDR